MQVLSRRSLLGGTAAALALAPPARAQQARPQRALPAPVAYKTIQGGTVSLRPFLGQRTALLIAPQRPVDLAAVERILAATDRGWDWYRSYFGREPTSYLGHEGKAAVVEVADTGQYVYTAIPLAPDTMTRLLTEAVRDRYNQAAFYLMGVGYWYFDAPLGRIAAFQHGFAHVHRFHAMEAAGLTGAPWDENLDFDNYKRSVIVEMLDRYLADQSLTWQNTLAAGKAPANPQGWGANQLAGSFFHRIRRDHGNAGYRRFWRLMFDAPKAETPRDSAARFVQIARAATGADYRWMMRDMSLPLVY